MLVYDVSKRETFENLKMWLDEVEQFSVGGGKDVVKLLVGNKVDQIRAVPRELADEFAQSRGMLFMEASAKTNDDMTRVFSEVVQMVIDQFIMYEPMSINILINSVFVSDSSKSNIQTLEGKNLHKD